MPIALEGALADELARALDVEGKILRALESLGPVGGRDIVLIGDRDGFPARRLSEIGGHVVTVPSLEDTSSLPTGSADVVVAWWSGFRGVDVDELGEAYRLLRFDGRLLVVHDYGRDDVSRLRGDVQDYGLWTRRDGPFLRGGFKIRVLHCWWTFDSLEELERFLGAAFGLVGRVVASQVRRPRLSYNVAVYHRSRPSEPAATSSRAVAREPV